MSRVCEICGKAKKTGNHVTFSHRGIKRSWTPNLRRVRVYDEEGTPKRMYVCTRCLRSGKVNRNRPGENRYEAPVEEPAVEESENQVEETTEEAPVIEPVNVQESVEETEEKAEAAE